MKISVIVAVKDNPEVSFCIEAFMRSDYDDKELILVNDCSVDNTLEVIHNYHVEVIDLKEHLGPALARNKGVEAASGELVFFLDSDAIVYPDTLSKIASYLTENTDCQGVTAIWDTIPLNKTFFSELSAIEKNVLFYHYFRESFGSNGSAIYREVFLAFGGFSPAFKRADAEDFELGLRLFNAGIKIPIAYDIKTRNGFVPTLSQGMKKYFRRAYLRSATLKNFGNKLIKPPVTSYNSTSIIWIYLLALSVFCSIPAIMFSTKFTILLLLCFAAWLLLSRLILTAIYRHKGLLFLARAIPTYLVLTAAIGAGGVFGRIIKPKEGNINA